jgi:hypothetical protein
VGEGEDRKLDVQVVADARVHAGVPSSGVGELKRVLV